MAYSQPLYDSDGTQYVRKTPSEKLDYSFDWAALDHGKWYENWLQDGEVIASYTLNVPAGIINESDVLEADAKSITVWLSGGASCNAYDISCVVTTNLDRVDEMVGRVKVD